MSSKDTLSKTIKVTLNNVTNSTDKSTVETTDNDVADNLAFSSDLRNQRKQNPEHHDQEIGGPKGPEPTRYGDWEKSGRCIDF